MRRLENHGRALRIEHEHQTLPAGWAGPRKWKQWGKECSEFVRGQLEPVVQDIRNCKAHLDRLTQEVAALVAEEKIPTGLGALTVALLDGEVCDWQRSQAARRWAVTPVAVPANTAVVACSASAALTDKAMPACEYCWSKRCGAY